MINFKYKVRDKFGKPLSGIIAGDSAEAVLSNLKKMGYAPVSVIAASDGFLDKYIALLLKKKVSQDELIMFTRQLVTLLSAGLPLLMSLSAAKEQASSRALKDALSVIMADIQKGLSFSEALSKHPEIFNELYINMVKAGEVSGLLDEILERLAALNEYQMETEAKIKAATRYPLIVVCTLVGAFLVVVTFVLPKFAEQFSKFNVELPMPTKILLFVNYAMHKWWHVLTAVIIAGAFFFKKYIQTTPGRFAWDRFKLNAPVFGPLILKITMSRFARTTAALIRSGLPLLQILSMVSKTVGNAVVARAIETLKDAVNEGKQMHEPMRVDKFFPPIVVQMVAIGESTGRLEDLLTRVSDYYDRQVDYAIRNLTTAIEPILIFTLGLMVLGMALAIFLPLWNIMSLFKR